MTERAKRDRAASNPGGMVCEECSKIFIGADWHSYCAVCAPIVAAREAAQRARGSACPHSFADREDSVYTEGLCPLCLCAKLERYRIAFSWMEDQDPQLVEAAREKFINEQRATEIKS